MDFDWIRLTNGEWLKGDLEALRDDKLEFESDELGDLTFDWADIAELRSPRQNALVVRGLETVIGTVLIRDDQIVMGTAEGERRFTRGALLSLVPGASSGLGYWSGKVSFGLSVQSGNTDQTTMNTQIGLRRSSPLSRITMDFLGNYGRTDNDTNIDNNRFTGRWDLFLSEEWYLTPVSLDFYRDRFQNIALQANPGAGVGYHAIDQPTAKLDLGLIGGWRYTRFDSVAAGEGDTDSTATVTPVVRVEWDITEKLEFDLGYQLNISVPETGKTIQHLIANLSLDLWNDVDLDLTFQWDRVGDPEPDSSGERPDPDDYRFGVGFGWSF